MRNIKKFTAVAVLSLGLLSQTAMAQPNMTDAQLAQFQQTVARLNLSDQQKPQVEQIVKSSMQERAQILRNAGITQGSKPGIKKLMSVRGPLKEVSERSQAQLATILDKTQMSIYNQIMEETRAKMRAKFKR